MDDIARRYVKLSLALGQHDKDYVDAYLGPEEWKREAESAELDLPAIRQRAVGLLGELIALEPAEEGIEAERWLHLSRTLESLITRVDVVAGQTISFDEESRGLYDAVAPTHPEEHFREILARLDGEVRLSGLSAPVAIERDALGVPTIRAANRVDVARATGFLHAQERFFQMDLLRRRAAGELSELFGPPTLQVDRDARIHRFRALAKRNIDNLSLQMVPPPDVGSLPVDASGSLGEVTVPVPGSAPPRTGDPPAVPPPDDGFGKPSP